jgi:hypothetical protein
MSRAGATILGSNLASGNLALQTSTSLSHSKLPFSFYTALDKIEEEILALSAENKFCQKEVFNLKSDVATAETVATTECADVQRYLHKEITILDELIKKQNERQQIEFKRLGKQV